MTACLRSVLFHLNWTSSKIVSKMKKDFKTYKIEVEKA